MPRILAIAVIGLISTSCQALQSPVQAIAFDTPFPAVTRTPETAEPEVESTETAEPELPEASPSPPPFIPTLIQLTEPGCCVQPFWSADGTMVLFIDQPQPTSPTGIYGVPVTGGEESLISERVSLFSPDGRYRAYLTDEGETIVEAMTGDPRWVIPNGGRFVYFSPTSLWVAWADTEEAGNFDQRATVISVSDIDGSESREQLTVYGGGIAGWLDDDHLLLLGRGRGQNQDLAMFSYSVTDGTRADLISNQRISGVRIAPGGEWITYRITMDPDSAAEAGIWVIKADGSLRYKLEVNGAGQWRDETHLLIIPYEPDAPSHRLWEFDVLSGDAAPVTDPALTPFRVANADWAVSPTGEFVVFVNAEDQALWLIQLTPE